MLKINYLVVVVRLLQRSWRVQCGIPSSAYRERNNDEGGCNCPWQYMRPILWRESRHGNDGVYTTEETQDSYCVCRLRLRIDEHGANYCGNSGEVQTLVCQEKIQRQPTFPVWINRFERLLNRRNGAQGIADCVNDHERGCREKEYPGCRHFVLLANPNSTNLIYFSVAPGVQ